MATTGRGTAVTLADGRAPHPGEIFTNPNLAGTLEQIASGGRDAFYKGPIAAAISEEKDAIEDIYEPFLIQIGFLDRTPRGRVATARAYGYFGLAAPGRDSRLW